jgi:hypothetical protein
MKRMDVGIMHGRRVYTCTRMTRWAALCLSFFSLCTLPCIGLSAAHADVQVKEERHRMDVYHNLFYDKAGLSLHSARLIPEVAQRPRIMDLGCGTGFWAIDMGE